VAVYIWLRRVPAKTFEAVQVTFPASSGNIHRTCSCSDPQCFLRECSPSPSASSSPMSAPWPVSTQWSRAQFLKCPLHWLSLSLFSFCPCLPSSISYMPIPSLSPLLCYLHFPLSSRSSTSHISRPVPSLPFFGGQSNLPLCAESLYLSLRAPLFSPTLTIKRL